MTRALVVADKPAPVQALQLVVVESPFAGGYENEYTPQARSAILALSQVQQRQHLRHQLILRNLRYLTACMRHAFQRGEAPFASHGLYPQVLDDSHPEQRALGIRAGLAWGLAADTRAVYTDLAVTAGMIEGIASAIVAGQKIEQRSIDPWRGWRLSIGETHGPCCGTFRGSSCGDTGGDAANPCGTFDQLIEHLRQKLDGGRS